MKNDFYSIIHKKYVLEIIKMSTQKTQIYKDKSAFFAFTLWSYFKEDKSENSKSLILNSVYEK